MSKSETTEERDIITRLRSAEKRCADRYGSGQAWADYGDAADEIERLREDLMALAHFVLGITPDRNTQTDEQVAATEAMIDAIALEALNV